MKINILLLGEKKEYFDENIRRTLSQLADIYECKYESENEIIELMRREIFHLAIFCIDEDSSKNYELYKRILTCKICDKSTKKTMPVFFIGTEQDCISLSHFPSITNTIFFNYPYDHNLLLYYFLEAFDIDKDLFILTDEQKKLAKEKIFIKGKIGKKSYIPEPNKPQPDDVIDNVKCLDKDIIEEFSELDINKIEKEIVEEHKRNILIVDDDLKVLKLMSSYLEDDYNVVIAKSGTSALKYLRKNIPDLILLDYMMPEENGGEVFNNIRFNTSCKTTPIIFLTGVADAQIVREILSLKPQGYILKPVNKETLIKKISPYL